jgi:hypothetical protein
MNVTQKLLIANQKITTLEMERRSDALALSAISERENRVIAERNMLIAQNQVQKEKIEELERQLSVARKVIVEQCRRSYGL